jgi:hypothetical protein
MNVILLRLCEKTKKKFISKALEACDTCMVSFDLWMSKGRVDTFVLIIHFLNHNWGPNHVVIDLFETIKIYGVAMAIQVNEVLVTYGLNAKILAYVKDDNNNLSIMTNALNSVISCALLRLITSFIGSCWGHAMFKCC